MRAFNYGQTIHAQPLTEKGRENWDRINWKDEQTATRSDDHGDIRNDSKTGRTY